MKTSKTYLSAILCLVLLLGAFPGMTAYAAAPNLTDWDALNYKERETTLVAPNIQITGGGSYDDSYIKFGVQNGTPDETLALVQSAVPAIEAGIVTSVGNAVYLGDGISAKQIGSINKLNDGQLGRNLQIDFSTPLVNGNFEDNGGSDAGWTINRNPVVLGPLASKTQARGVTITGAGPYTIAGTGYSFATDFYYNPASKAAWAYEGDERSISVTGATYNYFSEISTEATNHSLRLYFSGNLSVNNSGKVSYGSSFGPEAISTPFAALAGDTLAFDWKAANGGDDYEVYGFLYNVDTDTYTELMYGRGYSQEWTTSPGTIPANGTFQFRFVTGSYDRTGGLAVGASLYIDNVRVFGNYVDDAVAQKVARLVTYHNASNNPPETRTITIEARNKNGEVASGTNSVAVTQKNILTYQTSASANGTISGTLVQDLEASGTGTPVTAVPDAGFRFIGWSDGLQTATRADDASADLTVTALFAVSEAAIGTVDTHYNVDNDTLVITPNTSELGPKVTIETFLQNLTKNESSEWKVIPFGTNVTDETQFDNAQGKGNAERLKPGDKLAVKAADGSVAVYTIAADLGFAGGTGTADDPYRISSAEHLSNMKYELDKHFVLTGDVDLSVVSSGTGWEPIGSPTSPFTGTLNGGGYLIRNLTVNRPGVDHVGLFGYTDEAVIRNVGLENVDVKGGNYTGRLIGQADNTTITNSYAIGTVTGADYTGGLFGQTNDSIITNAYGSGSVTGTGNTGGLIGEANEGQVNHSYYNSDTTTQTDDSGKGTPKTTSELQGKATFENWDFSTIWVISEGSDYPKLMPREIQSVTAPSGATIADGKITANVPNGTGEVTVAIDVGPSASWKLYSDEACTQEITDLKLALAVGTTKAYVKVTAKDGATTAVYELAITRAAASSGGGGGPATEIITAPVEGGAGNAVSAATIKRTTASDGSKHDEVTLTEQNAQQAVDKVKSAGQDTARIVIPDSKDEVSEIRVTIPKSALKAFADGRVNLEIVTVNARISLPFGSLQGLGEDVYFRVLPIKELSKRKEVEQRARTEKIVRQIAGDNAVDVVGRPMTIETNLSSRAVDIVLPLTNVDLPADAKQRQQYLDNLVVFVEHSDGEKELVKGKIVDWKDGVKGISFRINKFSTFTIVHMANWSQYLANQQSTDVHKGYIAGISEGTFRPDQGISRAEMAALLARVGPAVDKQTSAIKYTDVSSTHWARSVIQTAQSTGLMTGFKNGAFGPEQTITRGEMAAIVARWLKLEGQSQSNYTDVQGHWADGYIALVGKAGMMQGMPDGKFQPNKSLTRAEAVATINRILKREPLRGVKQPSWQDVPASHWAFADIEEASKDHETKLHAE